MRAAAAGLAAALCCAASTAKAEGVVWDFGHHAGLDAVMQEEGAPRVFTTRGANFIRTRFVVEGAGEDDWTEGLDVLNTMPSDEPKSAKLKYEEIRAGDDPVCPSEWTLIGEEKRAVTFERRMFACSTRPAKTLIYRIVYGKRNVFILTATQVGAMSEESRAAWLALLASAKLMR